MRGGSSGLFRSPSFPQQPRPHIFYNVGVITPAAPAIRTSESWPTPRVAGPITVSKIPSGESWPTPTINLVQTISFSHTAIATGESWPTPSVAKVQSITFSSVAIATGETWPTPTVRGGIQFVNVVSSIPSGEAWPLASVSGGKQGTFLYIGRVDFSKYLSSDASTPLTIQSQTIGRWSATFDLTDDTGTISPQLGQTILITDYGRRVFAGCIQNVVWDRYLGENNSPALTRFHITATDKSSICDHRVITGKQYLATDPISGLPTQVSDVIIDIVTNFLNGEGIIPSGVPTDGSLGTLDADLPFNFPTVTQAFDQLALLSGTVWWIDVNGVLYFSPLDSLPVAPISLSALSRNFRGSSSGAQNVGGGLTTTRTTTNYYNKLYAVSNLNILPGSGSGGGSVAGSGLTEDFSFTVGQPGVRVAINQATNTQYAQAILTSVGIGSVVSMTVNGAPQTVVDITQYNGQTSSGPSDYLWFFFPGNNAVAWTYQPPTGATIEIEYLPYVATNVSTAQYGQALTPVDPSSSPLGTCGSGIYEGVIQVKDISSIDDLNAIALAELQRIGGVPTIIDFQTDYPGLGPGQLLNCDVPLSGVPIPQALSTQFLITSVKGVHQGAQMPGGSSFFWDVEATSQLDPGNWIKWYERFVARTQNALPVLQYEEASFVLGAGSTLSSGTSVTNPYAVGRTGLLVEALVGAGTPPVNQDLILTITRNGQTLISVTLPAGSTANLFYITAVPKSDQLYLYAHDALNCNVSYAVKGANPVKAANVTLKLRWAM